MCVYGGIIARLVRHRGMIVLAFILVFLLSEVDYTAGEKNTYCFSLATDFWAHFKHTPV